MNAETLPLNIKIESTKEVTMSGATSLLDQFLHNGVAIHAANNTISAQLHRLHQGLREEKKRVKQADDSAENSD
ncbi:hypothetical protein BC941DRAFT_420051 [Chlamydoabsidia padenii]|nr:hypothetical protein BC941DRAFT_420051 [Chlamydoabsidia padenii]